MTCSICLEKTSKICLVLPCGHSFHFRCIDKYNYYNPLLCPYCRQKYDAPIASRLRKRQIIIESIKDQIEYLKSIKNKKEKCEVVKDIIAFINKNLNRVRFFGDTLFEILNERIIILKKDINIFNINDKLKNETLDEINKTEIFLNNIGIS